VKTFKAALRLDPQRHGTLWITVMADCVTSLHHWRAPFFRTQGVSMGTVSSRKVRWHLRGQVCERTLEPDSPTSSHKPSRALDCISVPETRPPIPLGPPHPGEDGQHNNSSIYKPSSRFALLCVVHSGTQTDPLDQCALSLPEGDSHPRDPDRG